MIEAICPKCGKVFIPAPYHVYHDDKGFYCSWTCYNHRQDCKRAKIVKRVEQYTMDGKLKKTYTSANDASEYTGFSIKCIQRACREHIPYNGYWWKYKI